VPGSLRLPIMPFAGGCGDRLMRVSYLWADLPSELRHDPSILVGSQNWQGAYAESI
jgi:hypothetical protein